MSQNIIYVTTEENSTPRMLSYSAEELELLIDDLNLSMVGVGKEELQPFLQAIGLLTEIKILAKRNKED